ncbi:MAG: nucleotidyltransferase domain-containing protein [Armatimonadetes bacterium]|nr:nucleotidyltransferase domain-containing protein [Armatimonadota bacterium]
MSDQLREILSELKTRLTELYGERLVELILYGSQARGDAVEGSDIDVLVVLRGEVRLSREIPYVNGVTADLSLRHETVITCAFMDDQSYRTRSGPFLRNVRREGIRL